MKRILGLLLLSFLLTAGPARADDARNLLWDGDFDLGYGNNFWGAVYNNQGPNFRDMWSDGAIRLRRTIATRVYRLEEGDYALCAWVRRDPKRPADQPASLTLTLTNFNYYNNEKRNEYRKVFPVPAGTDWQRFGFPLTISAPVGHYFHVEVAGSADLLVDLVSLTPGAALPETRPRPVADLAAGFYNPEETNTYVDGEERVVELLVSNRGPKKRARVDWALYDFRDDLVRSGRLEEEFPTASVTRRRLKLDDLPYNGYRLACSVEGSPVLGDALLAILPRIDREAVPRWGADANLEPEHADFTLNLMKRLGMKVINTVSAGGGLSRWSLVQPEENRFVWRDAEVKKAADQGFELMATLWGFKHFSPWVSKKFVTNGKVSDLEGYTAAFNRYLAEFIRRYGQSFRWLQLVDGLHSVGRPAEFEDFYLKSYATARQTAAEVKAEVLVAYHGAYPAWWLQLFETYDPAKIEWICTDSFDRPFYQAEILNGARARGFKPRYMGPTGVGPRDRLRNTSLLVDRITHRGLPAGYFARQFMLHDWLTRTYGTDDLKYGPDLLFLYYDLRLLGQCLFMPTAGRTGIEYDNSPTLAMQAMAMFKHQVNGRRPVRPFDQPFSVNGRATADTGLFAYPFTDGRRALIVLARTGNEGLESAWRLSGVNFNGLEARDLFAQPIKPAADGSLTAPELPVYLEIPHARLEATLKELEKLAGAEIPPAAAPKIEVAPYRLEIGPEGGLRLSKEINGQPLLLLEGLAGRPGLPKPVITTDQRRLNAELNLDYGGAGLLVAQLTREGVSFFWRVRNSQVRTIEQALSFRLGPAAGGRPVELAGAGRTLAGRLPADGVAADGLLESTEQAGLAGLTANASRLEIKDLAVFTLPEAEGKNDFLPAAGFQLRRRDGISLLEADYKVSTYRGGGSRGVTDIQLRIDVK
ncbi:MAG TPA: hypothetical protein PKM61_01835 [bacterium]|nr:hypothetical protein [bacterium]